MNNFWRVLRLGLRHRVTFVASLVCALMVAALWGANIGTVYPFVEVAIKGQSLQQWVDQEIDTSHNKIRELEKKVATLAESDPESTDLQMAATRIESESHALAFYEHLRPWIYDWLPQSPFQTLLLIIGVLMVGTVVKSMFIMAHVVLVGRLSLLATFDLRRIFFRETLRMELASFGQDNSAELMSRFTYDMDGIAGGLKIIFGKGVREPLKMIACVVGAAWICWRLLVLSLVVAPVAAYLIARLGKLLKGANRKASEEMSTMYSILEETFQGIKIVKAFTQERYERRRFHQNNKMYLGKAMRIVRYDALLSPVTEVMGIMTICLALMAGAYLVLNHETHLLGVRMSERPLGLSSLLVFYGLLAGISDPFRKMSDVFNRVQRASAASDRVFQMIDRKPTITDPRNAQPLGRHHREIIFDNVNFSYTPGNEVLRDVDLKIPFGETLAIVGPNGCGKSTLANLIPRFYDPTAGSIKLDGRDLREVRLRDLRRQIGIVTQETLLFDDTVFNNIRYGSPHATREQVLQAAKQAHAHRFIEDKLSHGYETHVGQHGSSLSGGQRQRIALARAILRDPSLLILDEATSQIDLESEQLIHKVLEQFVRNRTTIIITHRMSTLALADRIVVMSAGKVLDIGTHDELLRRSDLFRRLHELQFKEIA